MHLCVDVGFAIIHKLHLNLILLSTFFFSTGVTQALTDLGVFDHASWNAGASGGGWYVLAHTLQSLSSSTGMASARSVFDEIRVSQEKG